MKAPAGRRDARGGAPEGASATAAWELRRARGHAGLLHEESAGMLAGGPPRRWVRVLEAVAPAVVLGAAQPEGHVDRARARRAGVEVARRRSGGSAVLVGPGECLWVDLAVPRSDPLWVDDVGRAAWWVGDLWAAALADAGVGRARAWREGFRRHAWSDRVCFAGVGPGEVLLPGPGGRPGPKVVGVCQRRTRHAALFQCAALSTWRPAALLDVLHLDPPERARGSGDLAGAAAGLGAATVAALVDAVLDRLPGGVAIAPPAGGSGTGADKLP